MATKAQRARRRRNRAKKAQGKQVVASPAPMGGQGNRSRRRGGGGGANSALVNTVLNFANPWSAQGPQKYRDGNNAMTIPYRMQFYHGVAIGLDSAVAGYYRGALMILPRLASPFYKPTYTATNQLPITAWAGTGEVWAEYSDLATTIKGFRITSWGVRIYSVGPALSSAGIVVVRTLNMDDPTTDLTGPNAAAQDRVEMAIQPGLDFYWVSRPTDVNSRNFALFDSSLATELDSWTIPQIHVEAASSTTSIRVEIVMNMEFTATPGDLFSKIVTPAPERHDGFMDGVSKLYKALPNVIGNPDHGVGPALMRSADAAVHWLPKVLALTGSGGANQMVSRGPQLLGWR